MSTTVFDPGKHDRGTDGKFTAMNRDEVEGSLGTVSYMARSYRGVALNPHEPVETRAAAVRFAIADALVRTDELFGEPVDDRLQADIEAISWNHATCVEAGDASAGVDEGRFGEAVVGHLLDRARRDRDDRNLAEQIATIDYAPPASWPEAPPVEDPGFTESNNEPGYRDCGSCGGSRSVLVDAGNPDPSARYDICPAYQ
ncbi:MAG: hypothetical protein ACRCYU_11945 [Nocardioides sp.]